MDLASIGWFAALLLAGVIGGATYLFLDKLMMRWLQPLLDKLKGNQR